MFLLDLIKQNFADLGQLITQETEGGVSPLHIYCKNPRCNREIVNTLLELGGDPNAFTRNECGTPSTPLYSLLMNPWINKENCEDIVCLLIQKGADLELRDPERQETLVERLEREQNGGLFIAKRRAKSSLTLLKSFRDFTA